MRSPVPRFRDVEKQASSLQPVQCVPPCHDRQSTMWFVRDACGIICGVITWMLVFFADFVVLFVMLVPSKNLTYSLINGAIFNSLAFLALASHFRAMCTDPVSLPLVKTNEERCKPRTRSKTQVLHVFRVLYQKEMPQKNT